MNLPSSDLDLDVLVIGGGPAGSSCAAILAQAGRRTAIVERGRFDEFRIGETIDPRTREPLARLGLSFAEAARGQPCRGMVAVWGSAEPRHPRPAIFHPYGPSWRVDRAAWDRRLFEHAESAGAAAFLGSSVESATWQGDHWRFSGSSDRGGFAGRARQVVEALGRKHFSAFAPHHDRMRYDRLVGFAFRSGLESAPGSGPESSDDGLDSAWVESIPDGWWYSAELPDRSRLAVLFSDADLIAKGDGPSSRSSRSSRIREALGQTVWTAARHPWIEPLIAQGDWRAFDARTSIRRRPAAPGWIATGDALASFDPLSGQGVLEAMESGIAAAEALLSSESSEPDRAAGLQGYLERVSERFNRKLAERWQAYGQETRWPDREFWRRRQTPIEIRSGRNPTASAATQA